VQCKSSMLKIFGAYHHGVYIGDNRVIHFGNLTGGLSKSNTKICETSLEVFSSE